MARWTFFTNYGHVIFLISKNPNITSKEMAQEIGITERAVQKIIHDLDEDGFINIKKVGRNNQYKIVGRKKLRHSIEKNCRIDELITTINKED